MMNTRPDEIRIHPTHACADAISLEQEKKGEKERERKREKEREREREKERERKREKEIKREGEREKEGGRERELLLLLNWELLHMPPPNRFFSFMRPSSLRPNTSSW